MNQSKNGIILVAIATLVIASLILLSDRDSIDNESKNTISNTQEQVKNDTKAVSINESNASKSDEKKSMSNVEEPESLSVLEANPEAIEIKAPEGPFDKYSGGEQVSASQPKEQTKKEESSIVEDENQKNQPIWMDQKLGDFKSVEKGPVIFNILPTSPDGLQGENPDQVVTDKSDKFASFGIPADYNYQRMPMYNGGYYISPMPSYLMPSMLPKSLNIEK